MEEVRLLLREEGREARNLLAFHVSINEGKIFRKPPCTPKTMEQNSSVKKAASSNVCNRAHVRSASTGRDKRSELRARYWALLFGNLQRAVNEIYNTVETHESLVECQETILVMENYIRDFRALAEWFKLKWEYENTPIPQRPTSLAWEVRKANLPAPHNERVSPSPSYKQGRLSPQNRQSKDQSTKIDAGLIATSPQPDTIPEVDEKTRDIIEGRNISNLKKETEHEVVLSPSEDQKTYINVIRKCSTSNAEAATSTDDIEFPLKIVKKVPASQKVSQASQTDDEVPVEKPVTVTNNTSPSKTTNKPEIKPSRVPTSLSSYRPPYSSAVSRTSRTISRTNINTSTYKPTSASTRMPTTSFTSNNTLKASPNKQLKTTARPTVRSFDTSNKLGSNVVGGNTLLRSKTSLTENKSKINTFTKQRTSLTIRNSTLSTSTKISSSQRSLTSLKSSSIRKPLNNDPGHFNKIHSKTNSNLRNSSTNKILKDTKDSDKDSVTSSAETIVNATVKQSVNENDAKDKQNPNKMVNGVVTDGWLTVKCRSRYKSAGIKSERRVASHWSNRFNEISATTSLPALALLQESDSEKSEEKDGADKANSPITTYLKRTNTILTKSSIKSVSAKRNDYIRNHKSKSEEPSLPSESTNGTDTTPEEKGQTLTNNQNSENNLNLNKNKIESKNSEDDSLLDKSESQDEEEHCRKTQQLSDEEALLTQEIAELQSCTVDVDTETDGTETDGEAGDDEEESSNVARDPDDDISLEARYEPVLAGLSWGERMDTLAALEDLVARHPGRALQLHQKLSNPERRRSLPETLRRYQAKHARAQQRRQALQQERTVRLQALLARVQDVKAAKNQLIEEKRQRMENRLQRAEMNRTEHLKSVVRKAHDEEEKLREIAFIKELEAQNKRHDFLELCKEQKGRLDDLREGQRKKIEEQAARGAAVEERRRALEQARHDRLERLQAERELRAERVGRRQQEIQEQAREKARGREERLSALHAQQLASTRELQKRISQKQEESARRHEENIEQIRQKALELSILRSHNDEPHTPALTPYESQKMCTVCNVHINSEVYLLSHLRGRAHQEAVRQATGPLIGDQLERYELAHIVDAPKDENHPRLIAARERAKTLRKRCKKLRQRMSSKGAQYETEYKPPQVTNQSKRVLGKSVQKLSFLINQGWASSTYNQLDRLLGETHRLLLKVNETDLLAFQTVGWFAGLSKLLILGLDVNTSPPEKSLIMACNIWQAACKNGNGGASNCSYSILSNKVIVLLDLLNNRLKDLANDDQLPSEPLATAIMQTLATILKNVPDETHVIRVQDVVSYAVCVGIVEQLGQCCTSVRGPIHNDANACSFLLAALDLLTGLASRCGPPPLESTILNNNNNKSQTICNGVINKQKSANIQQSVINTEDSGGGGSTARSNNNSLASSNSSLPTVNGAGSGTIIAIDPTHFTAALHATELVGVVSMLYGILLPTGASPRCEGKAPDPLPTPCLALTTSVFRLLKQVAELDLKHFQEALGAEGVSLQFRHIVGHLLWNCGSPPVGSGDVENAADELLHEVISVVGYFALKNYDNQMLLVSGYAPSVLQQLCSLPFPYFSVPKLSAILYPTLLGCCHDNPQTRQILEQELSFELLADFMNSSDGQQHPLIKLLKNDSKSIIA